MARNLSYSLPVVITKQGKRFVAYTPALDISTSGKSQREVKVRFAELANLFIEEIEEARKDKKVGKVYSQKQVEQMLGL